MPNRTVVARWLTKLKQLLLSDKVRPFIWIYYFPLWAWGIYGTFFAAPVSYVRPVMGALVYDLWIWLDLIGTSIVMCGMRFEDAAASTMDDVQRRWKERAWVRLQAGGHGCMFFVLLAYEISAVYSTTWSDIATFSIFALSPYVVGCLLLMVQGIAKSVTRGDR